MSDSFSLILRDSVHEERFDHVQSFLGEDESGSFGIFAGHARFMTVLAFGLAQFKMDDGQQHFVALAGGLLFMRGDLLTLGTRRFVTDVNFERISEKLRSEIAREERELRATRESLHTLEDSVLKRLYDLGRKRHELA